jgi:hypothetical protein
MSQLNVVKRSNSPDQVYYDVTITNFQSSNTIPPVFYYNESRTLPFINCPEDYYLSIVRFSVDTGTLPVFIPSIVPSTPTAPQNQVNLTIYNITLTYDDGTTNYTSGPTPLIWVPQDKSITPPLPPSSTTNGLQINDTGYYNCYSFQYVAFLITDTFKTALANLEAQVIAGGGTMPLYDIYTTDTTGASQTYSLDSADLPPLFQWDTSSDTANIFAIPQYDLNPAVNPALTGNNPIKIFFNAPLFNLFNSFPCTINGYSLVGGNENFQISVVNQGGLNTQLITPPQYDTIGSPPYPPKPLSVPYISVFQETSTIANLSPILAIVFTSNTMPITPNQVSTPLVLNNNQQLGFGGNNADFANIITDLVSETGAYRPSLVYTPQAQYRLVTLNGNRPLYNLDIQIFYRLRSGSLVPFRLASGGSVTLKVAFLKKDSVGTSTEFGAVGHSITSMSGVGANSATGGRR